MRAKGSPSLKHELQENRRSSRVTAGEEEAINWWGY